MSGGHFSRRTDRRAALRRGDLRTHWVRGTPRRMKKNHPEYNPGWFFFTCGRWDLNPHDIAITRSLVLLVCQFRHFRLLDANIILSFSEDDVKGFLCGIPQWHTAAARCRCFLRLRCAWKSGTGIPLLHRCRRRNSVPAP